MNVKYY